jgi:Domain of unknown function (DUF5916)
MRTVCALVLVAVCAAPALAQDRGPGVASSPAQPVVTRDAAGAVTIRATRIREPIVLDGRLSEPIYSSTAAIGGFVQQEPDEGAPATEQTDVWLLFDQRNIYVSGRCWDSHPELDVANEMRRDGQGTLDNEGFGVTFDTFHDRRNGYLFQITLAGGLFDGYITDERDMNRDWNTVWDAHTARFDKGWTFEIAIPFKSLRFGEGREQVWGVNFRRIVRWKNEISSVSPLPAALGRRAMNQLSAAATLVGLEPPPAHRTLELKPYAIGGVATDRTIGAAAGNTLTKSGGADVKLGVTDGLTADLTYNTDFAQVEEDEQQVNLTRVSTLFPEKRDFFLEGSGIFSFGGVQGTPRGGGGSNSGTPNRTDVPIVFFSRRIGLSNGVAVPIDVGGRVTGKAGPYSLGLLDIRTGSDTTIGARATNFSVVRVKRDILRRSAVGVLFTDRSLTEANSGRNRAFGVDGVFGFHENLNFNTYLAKTDTPGVSHDDWSYRAQLDYNADRYGLQLERLSVDPGFLPDTGFLARSAFRRNSAYVRFSPRPASIASIRKFTWDLNVDYITDPTGRLESRAAVASFRTDLENGDGFGAEYSREYERLDEPFALTDQVAVPVGVYEFPNLKLTYQFGAQHRASGSLNLERGRFYDGTRTSLGTSRGRVEITPQLSVEPGVTVNWIDIPERTYTSVLVTARVPYTLTPRMVVSALVQYNSDARTLDSSVRFRWEYQPGSDLFVVYTDGRDTTGLGFPALQTRGFVVKFTRLFRR